MRFELTNLLTLTLTVVVTPLTSHPPTTLILLTTYFREKGMIDGSLHVFILHVYLFVCLLVFLSGITMGLA